MLQITRVLIFTWFFFHHQEYDGRNKIGLFATLYSHFVQSIESPFSCHVPKIRLHENCQAIHCNSVRNHKLCFSISAVRYCTVFSHPFIYSDCLMRCVRLCVHHTTERSCNGDHHIVSLTWEVRVNFVAAIFNARNMKCLPKHWHAYGNGIYLHCRRFVCIYILWFYYNIAISIINARFLQSCHFHKQTPHTHGTFSIRIQLSFHSLMHTYVIQFTLDFHLHISPRTSDYIFGVY